MNPYYGQPTIPSGMTVSQYRNRIRRNEPKVAIFRRIRNLEFRRNSR